MSAHVVKPGECISSIAAQHGLTWHQVWDAPENEALRARRKDPHVLHPGDEVMIPPPAPPRVPLALEAVTTVVRRRKGHRGLTLRVTDSGGEPLREADYTLTPASGAAQTGKTDGAGLLRTELPVEVDEARLEVGPYAYDLMIGHLNPLEDTHDDGVSGMQARLANLGYHPGEVDGRPGPATSAALAAFQQDEGLEPTGALDATTRERLRARHGR